MVSAKTAALFAAAAESGALLSGRGTEFVAGLAAYGENLGIAFQLVDDALDYSGRQALMGKTVGDDFREAKMTLPVILALPGARGRSRLLAALHRQVDQTDDDLHHAITLLERHGRCATPSTGRAITAPSPATLGIFPDGPEKRALLDIVDFCVEREF